MKLEVILQRIEEMCDKEPKTVDEFLECLDDYCESLKHLAEIDDEFGGYFTLEDVNEYNEPPFAHTVSINVENSSGRTYRLSLDVDEQNRVYGIDKTFFMMLDEDKDDFSTDIQNVVVLDSSNPNPVILQIEDGSYWAVGYISKDQETGDWLVTYPNIPNKKVEYFPWIGEMLESFIKTHKPITFKRNIIDKDTKKCLKAKMITMSDCYLAYAGDAYGERMELYKDLSFSPRAIEYNKKLIDTVDTLEKKGFVSAYYDDCKSIILYSNSDEVLNFLDDLAKV